MLNILLYFIYVWFSKVYIIVLVCFEMKSVGNWILVLGFFIVFGLLWIVGDNFTGNVVWVPGTVVNNCSDSDIVALWDEIFIESSDGISVFRENLMTGDNCTQFIAIKGNGVNEIWYLLYDFSSSGLIVADYVSVTSEMYEDFFVLDNFFDLTEFRLSLFARFDEISNYTINDEDEALVYFSSKFKIYPDSFLPLAEWEGLFVYFSNNVLSEGNFEYNTTYTSFSNKSWSGLFTQMTYIGEDKVFNQDISNFTFEKNSSWNFAFNIENIIDFGNDWVFNISTISNSINIDYKIENGTVYFKPMYNTTGNSSFVFGVIGPLPAVFSNIFNVEIVECINYAPVLKENIGPIEIPRGGEASVIFDFYFDDPNGDTITYRVDENSNLDIDVTDYSVTFKLKDSFTDFVILRIYASDGIEEIQSNKIYIFEDEDNITLALVDDIINNSADLNGTPNGSMNINESINNTVTDNNKDKDEFGWIFWSVIIFIILVLVFVLIWFFILRNNVSPDAIIEEKTQKALVDNYLKELNISKKQSVYTFTRTSL